MTLDMGVTTAATFPPLESPHVLSASLRAVSGLAVCGVQGRKERLEPGMIRRQRGILAKKVLRAVEPPGDLEVLRLRHQAVHIAPCGRASRKA